MNVTELENKHVGQRATVTFPESGTNDSFTGEVTSISHSGGGDRPLSTAIFKIGNQSMVVMSLDDPIAGPAIITFH